MTAQYKFLSSKTKAKLAEKFGEDFDLLVLESRPRKEMRNTRGEIYLETHDLWWGVNWVEIFAELAAAGFTFHEGLGLRRYRDLSKLNRKQLVQLVESLDNAGIQHPQVDAEIASRPSRTYKAQFDPNWQRKENLRKRIAVCRGKISALEKELFELDQSALYSSGGNIGGNVSG